MAIFNSWIFWVVVYLISAVVFAQSFKVSNRNMTDASALTILLEMFTAAFAILFIPFFPFKFNITSNILLTLLIVVIIYAITDRLNIEARYGLEPSIFSMLKQLSTVFLIILGFIFLNEEIILKKVVGSIIIIAANLILAFDKGKFEINKYFIMSFISNFLFAIAMLININISDNFNLGIYTIITVLVPSFIISIVGRYTPKKLIEEYKKYNKKYFILSAFTWCLMLISSVRAYQLTDVSLVAPLLTLTAILNAIYEFIWNKNKSKFIQKIIAAILILLGVLLIKL